MVGFFKLSDSKARDRDGTANDISARLVKLYGAGDTGQDMRTVIGTPDPTAISMSHVERHNLTIRMSNRRFARRTNAFSKKFANHCHMLAIFFCYHNCCR